jgi:hypothetical protein
MRTTDEMRKWYATRAEEDRQERMVSMATELAKLEVLVRRSRGILKDPQIRAVLRRLDELREAARVAEIR